MGREVQAVAQRRVLSLYLVFEHRDPFDEIDKVGMVRMQQPAMQQPATTNNACAVTQCGCACACASDECADSSVNTPQQCESNLPSRSLRIPRHSHAALSSTAAQQSGCSRTAGKGPVEDREQPQPERVVVRRPETQHSHSSYERHAHEPAHDSAFGETCAEQFALFRWSDSGTV